MDSVLLKLCIFTYLVLASSKQVYDLSIEKVSRQYSPFRQHMKLAVGCRNIKAREAEWQTKSTDKSIDHKIGTTFFVMFTEEDTIKLISS